MARPGDDALTRAAALAAAQAGALAAGALLHAAGADAAGDATWAISSAVALVPLTVSAARTLAARRLGVDLIALLAIAAALALGEYLAGAIVALMLAGGTALEDAAGGRARRELAALVARAPVTAHLRRDGDIVDVPVGDVGVGDVVMVRAGEVLPVDGTVEDAEAVLDESALTGEPLPVVHPRGDTVRSGTANAGPAIDVRATRPASEGAYAALVRLVRQAEAEQAPLVRLADRYAAYFLPLTLALAIGAWLLSGDPVRALAVLVVATPCPLILAAPVALLSGVSRAARRGVITKGSGPIEQLGRARTVLLDKTGTLTLGAPGIAEVATCDGLATDEMLRLVASLEQLSPNVVGRAIVHEARARGLALTEPADVVEGAGMGIEGRVDGRLVSAGNPRWLARRGITADGGGGVPAGGLVLVGVDGRLAGRIVLHDTVRLDAAASITRLRAAGVATVAMVTGDSVGGADAVARELGIDRVHADLTPQGKVDVVRAAQRTADGGTVVMVGDGINDAPALAAADVGVAMAAGGATVSSEAADVVIAIDRLDRVVDAVEIGRRSLAIARQSVVAGMGLSIVAMVAAALGHIPPVAGAVLQEAIDVAVILNALRALRA